MGKSLCLGEKKNGEIYFFYIGGFKIVKLTFNIHSKDGAQATRSYASLRVILSLRGLKKWITLAFQRCVNLHTQQQ